MTALLDDESWSDRLVTVSEIVTLTGKSQSTVSNWRRRYDDFPQPAGTAPSGGDLFRLEEIDRWLRDRRGISMPERTPQHEVDALADGLRGRPLPTDVGTLIAIAAAYVKALSESGLATEPHYTASDRVDETVRRYADHIYADHQDLYPLFEPLAELDPETLRLLMVTLIGTPIEALAEAVDAALSRADRYGGFRTPPEVAELLVSLAGPYSSVLDPAVGSGEILIKADKAASGSSLYGQELNENAWRTATARLFLRDLEANIAAGDSFTDDMWPSLRVDAVISEPPAAARIAHPQALAGDHRWELLATYKAPPARAADFAWIAHAVAHLKPDGHAVLLLPAGSLFRGGTEARLRSELLRQGVVEAVIELPGGYLQDSKAPAAIWLLRNPVPNPGSVLLVAVDAGADPTDERVRTTITRTVNAWRSGHRDPAIPGLATTVSVLRLLKGDAPLLPSRWLSDPLLVDADARIADVEAAYHALEIVQSRSLPAVEPPDLAGLSQPRQRVRVRDLVDQGLAGIVRPSRLKREDYRDEGIPVWLPADVHRRWERAEETRFAAPVDVDSRHITMPGDIVVTTIGGLRARVDTDGGHVLGTSLHALRLAPGTLNPEIVAELLMSDTNEGLMTGGTIPRVNLMELQIPMLDLAESAELRNLLEALELSEGMGHELARRANELRATLVGALATAVVRMQRDSKDSDA